MAAIGFISARRIHYPDLVFRSVITCDDFEFPTGDRNLVPWAFCFHVRCKDVDQRETKCLGCKVGEIADAY